jgi:PAS domain-containing protein
VSAGARLDRLPISSFHRRIMALIGIGMFFDGFDLYVAATVQAADAQFVLLAEAASLAIFTIDDQSNILFANPAVERRSLATRQRS